MDHHVAARLAEEFAEISAFHPAPPSYANQRSLLCWLDARERAGWAVVYASAYVPSQSSVGVFGMMTSKGAWAQREASGLASCWNGLDQGWCYQGGRLVPNRMQWGDSDLLDAYPLTYRRRADGRAKDLDYVEIDQRLTIPEGLHWYPELKAWGRWTEAGRLEPFVIHAHHAAREGTCVDIVFISKAVLASQVFEGAREFVQFIDGAWAVDIHSAGWTTAGEEVVNEATLAYRRSAPHASWARFRGARLPLIDASAYLCSIPSAPSSLQFLCWPYLPRGDEAVPPCHSGVRAEDLRSYFDEPDHRCLEITPVFFRSDVLDKYLNAPQRYQVNERSITARGAWHLETYDINDAGQVHTYLVYLGRLPLEEQRYWLTFNEAPRAPISKRAYLTDIEGDFPPASAVVRLRQFASRQERANSEWWSCRDASALERYLPCTNRHALNLWKQSIGHLHQVTVENLTTNYFRTADNPSPKQQKKDVVGWLAHWFHHHGVPQADRDSVLVALRRLRHLRNVVFAHGRQPSDAADEITEAMACRLGLRGHSLGLTADVADAFEALERIVASVSEISDSS